MGREPREGKGPCKTECRTRSRDGGRAAGEPCNTCAPEARLNLPASGATINDPESPEGEGRGHRHYQAEGGLSAFDS